MSKSKESNLDWNTILRALGFASVGVGSLVIGSSIDGLNQLVIADAGVAQLVIILIAIALATVGPSIHGVLGLISFGAGNALLGATTFSGIVPHWGQSIGLVALVAGLFLRTMIDD